MNKKKLTRLQRFEKRQKELGTAEALAETFADFVVDAEAGNIPGIKLEFVTDSD